jgi:hypothetical protein
VSPWADALQRNWDSSHGGMSGEIRSSQRGIR